MKKFHLNENLFEGNGQNDIRYQVYTQVVNAIDNAFDAFAYTLAEKVPGYDPYWADEDGSTELARSTYEAQDRFAREMTNLLLANMDK